MKSEKSYSSSSAMKSCHRTAWNRWRFQNVTNKLCDDESSTIMSRDSDAAAMPLPCDEPCVPRDVTVPSLLPRRVIDLNEEKRPHRRMWPKLCQKQKLSEKEKSSRRNRLPFRFCHHNNIYILGLLLLSVFVRTGLCNSPPR